MIALRVAEVWHQRIAAKGGLAGRVIAYGGVAAGFHTLTDELYRQLELYERQAGRSSWEIAAVLLDDEPFLGRVVDWFAKIDTSTVLLREAASPPTIVKG
jgi:hypothetical protein